jgi:hypothetical protein
MGPTLPRRTGQSEWLDLTGYLLPWRADGQPALVGLIGLGDAVPVFSSLEAFDRVIATLPMDYDSLKKIDDPRAFIESIPPWLIIAVDLHWSERGTMIYSEVQRP